MLATTGDDGDPAAKDEVLKHSSRIAAAVALFPPTDLRNWTTDPPEAIAQYPALKPPLSFDAEKEPDVSPILFVSDKAAPSLMIHGDKDELVPIEHSQKTARRPPGEEGGERAADHRRGRPRLQRRAQQEA